MNHDLELLWDARRCFLNQRTQGDTLILKVFRTNPRTRLPSIHPLYPSVWNLYFAPFNIPNRCVELYPGDQMDFSLDLKLIVPEGFVGLISSNCFEDYSSIKTTTLLWTTHHKMKDVKIEITNITDSIVKVYELDYAAQMGLVKYNHCIQSFLEIQNMDNE